MGLSFFAIAIGAILGAWLRWGLGIALNPIFPTFPLGTLVTNLLGGLLIGFFMAITRDRLFVSETMRLAIVTGFLGALTTFSTFSAEAVTLLLHREFMWSIIFIASHLVGSLLATFIGIYIVELIY